MTKIKEFIQEKVIIAGIMWLLGLLNPVAAFIKACKAIFDIVKFFIERAQQVGELVNAILDSVAAVVGGNLGEMAGKVENALAKAIPVAIGFLASLLGLGGISDKIRSIIQAIQEPIHNLISKVLGVVLKPFKWIGDKVKAGAAWAKNKVQQGVAFVKDKAKAGVAFVKGKAAALFGKGRESEESDAQHEEKVSAGLAEIDVEERGYATSGAITRENAVKVAAAVQSRNPVFKSIEVVSSGDRWDYEYVASPGKKKKGLPKAAPAGGTASGHSAIADAIANGHAYDKHVITQAEFPGVTDRNAFAAIIDGVLGSPVNKPLSGGRHAYWEDSTNTVVITNPAASDKGTCFRPTKGKSYYDNDLK
jgi:hypothetical protein